MAVVWTGLQYNCMNLYAAPVMEALHISRTQFMFVLSIPAVISATTSLFFFGAIEQRIGVRRMMVVGGTLNTLSFLSWTLMNSLWMLYLGGVLYGLGCGITAYTCVSAAVNIWFKQRIGTLVGAVNSLGSGAGIVFAIVIGWLITAVGWRYSFALSTVVSAAAVVACAVLYRGNPEDLGVPAMYADAVGGGTGTAHGDAEGVVGAARGSGDAGNAAVLSAESAAGRDASGNAAAKANGSVVESTVSRDDSALPAQKRGAQAATATDDLPFREALRKPRIWLLALGYFLLGTTTYALMSTLPLFALDFGFGDVQGQVVSASLFASALVMVPLGMLCDKAGTKWGLALIAVIVFAAAVLLRLPSLPLAAMLVVAVLAGAAYGACGVTVGVGVKEALGEVEFSKKLGVCSGCMYVGLAVGPVLTNSVYDALGSYAPVLALYIGLAVAMTAIFFVGMRKRAAS